VIGATFKTYSLPPSDKLSCKYNITTAIATCTTTATFDTNDTWGHDNFDRNRLSLSPQLLLERSCLISNYRPTFYLPIGYGYPQDIRLLVL
jgi:hypothetical protein